MEDGFEMTGRLVDGMGFEEKPATESRQLPESNQRRKC
jgi:hypothetical protein